MGRRMEKERGEGMGEERRMEEREQEKGKRWEFRSFSKVGGSVPVAGQCQVSRGGKRRIRAMAARVYCDVTVSVISRDVTACQLVPLTLVTASQSVPLTLVQVHVPSVAQSLCV